MSEQAQDPEADPEARLTAEGPVTNGEKALPAAASRLGADGRPTSLELRHNWSFLVAARAPFRHSST